MFMYPDAVPRPIASAEIKCPRCRKWIVLSPEQTAQAEADWRAAHSDPHVMLDWRVVKCQDCRDDIGIPMVGKYDLPGAAKNRCGVMYVKFATKGDSK